MLSEPALTQTLWTIGSMPVTGTWARAIAHEHLEGPPPGFPPGSLAQPLWAGGAPLTGARYTPKGGAPALYLAETADLALREVAAVVSVGGRGVLSGSQPFTVVQVNVCLREVLNLGDPGVRSSMGVSLQQLTANWRLETPAPTQILGDAIAKHGRYDGILAPSAKDPASHILVVLVERLDRARGTFCEVIAGGRLAQRLP